MHVNVQRLLLGAAALLGVVSTASAQPKPIAQALGASCQGNDAGACTTLGIMYTDGDGIAVELDKGARLFQQACTIGDGRGCMLWGYALQYGRGTPIDLGAALAANDRACTQRNALGCNNAGSMYQAGAGVGRDEATALVRFTSACGMRLGIGCRNLGVLHADATQLRQDRVPAVAAFARGCEFGDLDSCNKQAWHLEQGMGTTRDIESARRLYAKACDGGYALACDNGRKLGGGSVGVAQGISTGASSGGGSRAAPADGYFVCSAFMSSTRKLFYTFPFEGASSRANEFALAYAAMLRGKGYASAGAYAPAGSAPPQLTVDCRHNRTQKQAMDIKDQLAAGAARERMTPVPTSFDPQ